MAIDQRRPGMAAYTGDQSRSPIEIDDAIDPLALHDPTREALLARIISSNVIPIVLANNKTIIALDDNGPRPTVADIDKLTALILGPDNTDALEYIYFLRQTGISLDHLHLELLEPTARHLGELWDNDQLDFFAVTAGVNKLQRIVHHFADLERIQPYGEMRRALVMVTPGEDHNFGNQLVQKFMRAAGWSVSSLSGNDSQTAIDLVSKEWIAVVGFSISGRYHIDDLTNLISSIRKHSLNPYLGVMIGGPMVAQEPELVEQVGADGTASNAAAAVILAKKILAKGLTAAADPRIIGL